MLKRAARQAQPLKQSIIDIGYGLGYDAFKLVIWEHISRCTIIPYADRKAYSASFGRVYLAYYQYLV